MMAKGGTASLLVATGVATGGDLTSALDAPVVSPSVVAIGGFTAPFGTVAAVPPPVVACARTCIPRPVAACAVVISLPCFSPPVLCVAPVSRPLGRSAASPPIIAAYGSWTAVPVPVAIAIVLLATRLPMCA
jgi:hypothetical protein